MSALLADMPLLWIETKPATAEEPAAPALPATLRVITSGGDFRLTLADLTEITGRAYDIHWDSETQSAGLALDYTVPDGTMTMRVAPVPVDQETGQGVINIYYGSGETLSIPINVVTKVLGPMDVDTSGLTTHATPMLLEEEWTPFHLGENAPNYYGVAPSACGPSRIFPTTVLRELGQQLPLSLVSLSSSSSSTGLRARIIPTIELVGGVAFGTAALE
jgi:hypothetical protein